MNSMFGDELILANDSRYKTFVVSIDKVLKQFESSSEWVDLIPNLSKLKKVKQIHPIRTYFIARLFDRRSKVTLNFKQFQNV